MPDRKPSQPKRGDVMRYHPVIGLPQYVRVRVASEPYELGDGSWICKANRISDGCRVYPCLEALSEDHDDV